MQRARDELLAGAALALDQDGRVARRYPADVFVDLLHRRRLADDFRSGLVLGSYSLTCAAHVVQQTLTLDGLPGEQA